MKVAEFPLSFFSRIYSHGAPRKKKGKRNLRFVFSHDLRDDFSEQIQIRRDTPFSQNTRKGERVEEGLT